jgi:hypothetical protein
MVTYALRLIYECIRGKKNLFQGIACKLLANKAQFKSNENIKGVVWKKGVGNSFLGTQIRRTIYRRKRRVVVRL